MTVTTLTPELKQWQMKIESLARGHGLDFYDTIFEVLSFDELNEVASFGGFPTRYPHWRFGMQYEQLSKGYQFGLQKIYELVINNDPCYAYLMVSNPLVDQKMVMAHVYGHCDFFKNNYWFSFTNRKMMDEMANHGTRIRRIVDQIGLSEVESFLDAALTLENLIDHMAPFVQRTTPNSRKEDLDPSVEQAVEPHRLRSKDYMEAYINPPEYLEEQRARLKKAADKEKSATPEPIRDILLFLIENAPLRRWQVDILEIVRKEAYYFNPQGMTKIMNEGWATYWHQKMMIEELLTSSEIIDYAETMSGTLSGGGLNPYRLGLALYHDIEERWNTGRHGREFEACDDQEELAAWDDGSMTGREKIFEVRRFKNDVSFIDEFLTEDFCHRNKLFVYEYNPQTRRREIATRDFEPVKEQLLRQINNAGHPVIDVVDSNHRNRGELLLNHRWDLTDLQDDYARATLSNIHRLWNRPVLLITQRDEKPFLYRADSDGVTAEKVSDS